MGKEEGLDKRMIGLLVKNVLRSTSSTEEHVMSVFKSFATPKAWALDFVGPSCRTLTIAKRCFHLLEALSSIALIAIATLNKRSDKVE